jgi:hypothetical protein
MRLVWEDDFAGTELNMSLWNVLEQVHRGGVYTKQNVRLRDGNLVLQTRAQNLTILQGSKATPFYVSSGAVNTSGLAEQVHGRWEARVRLPMVYQSPGYVLHSSIWLFSDVTAKDSQHSGCPQEIDVRGSCPSIPHQMRTSIPHHTLSIQPVFKNKHALGHSQVVEQYTASAGPISSAVANLHPFNGTRESAGGCKKVSRMSAREHAFRAPWCCPVLPRWPPRCTCAHIIIIL